MVPHRDALNGKEELGPPSEELLAGGSPKTAVQAARENESECQTTKKWAAVNER